jgi:hypothetical protein
MLSSSLNFILLTRVEASALGGSLGSLNAGSRARSSLQYDSLNDPHLRDYFERKFQLSSAVRQLLQKNIQSIEKKKENMNNFLLI